MAVFCCTKKVIKELGLALSLGAKPSNALAHWYVNLLWEKRKKNLIFVNPNSRYSMLLIDVRRGHIRENFVEEFHKGLLLI